MAICGNPDCKQKYTKAENTGSFDNWCSADCKDAIIQIKFSKGYEKQSVKLAAAKANPKPIKQNRSLRSQSIQGNTESYSYNSTLKRGGPLKGSALGSLAYKVEKKARDKKRKEKSSGNMLQPFVPVMSMKEAHDKAVKVCHLYIRTRDFGKPCPCCGKSLGKNYQAGHFIPAGSCSFLKFYEFNIHGQRYDCNMMNGGDSGQYNPNLRTMYGDKEVDRMKAIAKRNPVVKRSLQDYLDIIDYYTKKLNYLIQANLENDIIY